MKVKVKDFKTTKNRVGKDHLRKYKSLDEKLLSNLGRVKKKVKLTTQSISINKDSLNITSRRLTFPELVSKSRHSSENVRNHSLLGLTEFIRRYEDEGRVNLFVLLQVSCSSLLSEYPKLRISSRNLLFYILSTYFSNSDSCTIKCSEVLHLYLVQGVLATNWSKNDSFCEDVYTLISLILERYPWVLRDHYEKVLISLLENSPDSLSFKRFNCIYSLCKLVKNLGHKTREDLVEYLINVQYRILTNTNLIVNGNLNCKKESNDKLNKISSVKVNNEIECLSTSSMVVKSFKLLLVNYESIKKNDFRIIDLLLSCDLSECDNMTQRGKETFEKLYTDLVLTKTELSLVLMGVFSKYHLPLLMPLIQIETLRDSLDKSRIVQILFNSIYLRLNHKVDFNVKSEWIDKILIVLSESKLNFLGYIKSYLNSLKITKKNKFDSFSDFDGYDGIAIKNQDSFEDESQSDEEFRGLGLKDIKDKFWLIYGEALKGLLESVLHSPRVWPFLAYLKGISPSLYSEIFGKSHLWSYFSSLKFFEPLIPKEYNSQNLDFDGDLSLELDHTDYFREYLTRFDDIMSNFIDGINRELVQSFLKFSLHLSKKDTHLGFYYKLIEIPNLSKEDYTILSRIFLNLAPGNRLKGFLTNIIKELALKSKFTSSEEFVNVLLSNVFNRKSGTRVDSKGRVIIGLDPYEELLEDVNYIIKFYIDLMILISDSNSDGSCSDYNKNCSEVEDDQKEIEEGEDFDSFLKYSLKSIIDKYLMSMCTICNKDEYREPIDVFVDDLLKPLYEAVEFKGKNIYFKILKKVLEEYKEKDSMPEWILESCN